MTEDEWLNATDPQKMLEFLTGKASDRKLRRFACACGLRISSLMSERGRDWLQLGEQFAEGLLSSDERKRAPSPGASPFVEPTGERVDLEAWRIQKNADHVGWFTVMPGVNAVAAAKVSAHNAVDVVNCYRAHEGHSEAEFVSIEREKQAALLRCIFGNPFRPVTLDRSWLTATVTNLAQGIYEDRQRPSSHFDNQRMAILADALEEAGCDVADILGHFRVGGDHVRGCWAVDLLLEME